MSESTLYIGNKNYSSWSLRPWLALKQAGAAFKEVLIPLDRPETMDLLQRHTPARRVPTLTNSEFTLVGIAVDLRIRRGIISGGPAMAAGSGSPRGRALGGQ